VTHEREQVLPQRNDKPRAQRVRRWLRRVLLFAPMLLGAWFGLGFATAWAASMPWSVDVDENLVAGKNSESVELRARDGVVVRGWLLPPKVASRGAVVLAAGIRGNRVAVLRRARFYVDEGFTALLVDLRGTGESDPERISMGWHEALDLLAARDLLRARGHARVGAHGVSLGGAAATLTAQRASDTLVWDFLVVEQCYTNLSEALAARFPLLPFAAIWPVQWWGEWLLDLDADDVDCVAALRRHAEPTLLVQGSDDELVGENALQRLFDASAANVKRRHVVDGAGHDDLWPRGGDALKGALRAFLDAL